MKKHSYSLLTKWTGNTGTGTSGYRDYERSHIVYADTKPEILASSDPAFRGDNSKYNPEELLVASLSGCHMLSYLHLCAINKIIVIDYTDNAIGTMIQTDDGSGRFTEVTLQPQVTVSETSMIEKANELHHQANKICFIANSCNFPVYHNAVCNSVLQHS